MKLNTEIKTAHLLVGIGICIALGILLARLLTPHLFTPTELPEETLDAYRLPDVPHTPQKPLLNPPRK